MRIPAVELGISAALLFAGCKGISPDNQPPRSPIAAPPAPDRMHIPTVEATILASMPQSIRDSFPGIEAKVPLQVVEVGSDVKVNVWNYSDTPVDAKAMTNAIDTILRIAEERVMIPISILTSNRDIYPTSVSLNKRQASRWTYVMISPTMSLPTWAGIHYAGTGLEARSSEMPTPKFTFAQITEDVDESNSRAVTELCQGLVAIDPNSITADMVKSTGYTADQLFSFTKEGVCNLAFGNASYRKMRNDPFSELQGKVMPASEFPVAVYGSRLGSDFYNRLPGDSLFQRR